MEKIVTKQKRYFISHKHIHKYIFRVSHKHDMYSHLQNLNGLIMATVIAQPCMYHKTLG